MSKTLDDIHPLSPQCRGYQPQAISQEVGCFRKLRLPTVLAGRIPSSRREVRGGAFPFLSDFSELFYYGSENIALTNDIQCFLRFLSYASMNLPLSQGRAGSAATIQWAKSAILGKVEMSRWENSLGDADSIEQAPKISGLACSNSCRIKPSPFVSPWGWLASTSEATCRQDHFE